MSKQAIEAINAEYLYRRERVYKGHDWSSELEAFKDFSRGVMVMEKIHGGDCIGIESECSTCEKMLQELK